MERRMLSRFFWSVAVLAAVAVAGPASAQDDPLCHRGWAKCASNPVLQAAGDGGWDHALGWNRAVLYDGATFHMWYAVYSPPPPYWGECVAYATSPDGITWTKHPDPVLCEGGAGEWDVNILPGAVLFDGQTYTMWYTAFLAGDEDRGGVGVATSPDGITWTKHPGNPVLTGDAGTFDGAGPLFASVVHDGQLYRMWYMTRADDFAYPNYPDAVGHATSPDGITWAKHPEPVLSSGDTWDRDDFWALDVAFDGATYHMFYDGNRGSTVSVGYASSPDGISWTKGGGDGGPVVRAGWVDSDWDSVFVAEPSVVIDGTVAHMWFRGAPSGGIGYATTSLSDLFDPADRLNDNRFAVKDLFWWNDDGASGGGVPVKLTDDSSYYWFFDQDNIELVIKVLDGCGVNGHYWVFASGLTNLGVSFTVADTVTSENAYYLNMPGDPFAPILDTAAFAACD